MATNEKDKLRAEIEAVVRDRIHSGEIVSVSIERDTYTDGDEVILVNVIFNNRKKTLDASETSQLTRAVWKRLIEMNIAAVPFLSFIAKSEAGKVAAA